MQNTINFEISKRLNDLWLLDNFSNEFYFLPNKTLCDKDYYWIMNYWKCDFSLVDIIWWQKWICNNCGKELKSSDNFKRKCWCSVWDGWFFWTSWESSIYQEEDFIKTLTFEEVLEFLSKTNSINFFASNGKYSLSWGRDEIDYQWTWLMDSKIEAVEKLLNILIDKNLLWQNKN